MSDDFVPSAAQLLALNRLAAFLAVSDVVSPGEISLVVLAGNAVLPTIEAALRLVRSAGCPLLITGGIGHSTRYLEMMIARHPTYGRIMTAGRPEANILADIAVQFWHAEPGRVIRETKSTNCGENALFTKRLVDELCLAPSCVALVQDPTMQRRTHASFLHAWSGDARPPDFANCPGFLPQLVSTEAGLVFDGSVGPGVWPIQRFVSLVMGEIPRLRDDQHGYGPRGRNFISHVDVPDDVEAAYAELLASDVVRDRMIAL